MSDRSVVAIRGAISIPEDTAEAIREGASELVREVLERNGLGADDLISIIFTSTEDLCAEFPAVAAREMGLSAVPLLCTREIPVVGSLPRCVRVMVHANVPEGVSIRHVYLREARQLRTDLPE
ncbi:MAG: chorismate mutase [Miltoncostaeaceae bacterium]